MVSRVELSVYYLALVVGLFVNTAISFREGSTSGFLVSISILVPTARLWWYLTDLSNFEDPSKEGS